MSVNCSFIELSEWHGDETPGSDIRIWHGDAIMLSDCYPALYPLLNNAEQTAAARYRHETNRGRYVIQHGILRLLLGRRLSIAPANVAFGYNPNKKPYLATSQGPAQFFNLSNSANQFLIAIGDDELGVDIEHIKPGFEWQDIAERYFGNAEMKYIAAAPDPAQAFFVLWTRKEALLKACGMGIDDNLPVVPALDGLHPLPAYYPVNRWQTGTFTLSNNFIGSVTYPASQKNLHYTQLTTDMVTSLLTRPDYLY